MSPPRVFVLAFLIAGVPGVTGVAWARQGAPAVSVPQRAALDAAVRAVHRRSASEAPDISWQSHVLRASDGSHYVALRATVPGDALPSGPVVLYVRLATRPTDPPSTTSERSAVLEWLDGERNAPLPMRAGGSMSVPRGEMPVGSIMPGRDPASESVAALRLLTLERDRAARRREDREADRRKALESAARARPTNLLPFEDFDVAATLTPAPGGGVEVWRSLTAGPGDYDLSLAWATPAARGRPIAVRVVSRRLTLPAAGPGFDLSDIVLADDVRVVTTSSRASEQNAHPYLLGALDAAPARDDRFRVDEKLSVLMQVVNPSGDAGGKPDVDVAFAVTRFEGDREVAIGALPTQRHNGVTLPADFSTAQGHPLFVAVQAPLTRFARGRYRLAITATDVLTGRQAARDVRFTVTGTPQSLLREAPAPGQAFRRDAVLTPSLRQTLVSALTPIAPSTMLRGMLEAAVAGRFADLVRDAAVEPGERPAAIALRAFGLYALGDTPRAVAVQLQQALTQGAPAAPVQVLLGATHALAGADTLAIDAWNRAREGQVDDPSIAALLVDAYMRLGDAARATAMARAAVDASPGNAAASRGLAAASIAAGRYAEALDVLAPLSGGNDADTDFLVIHALYGGVVGRTAPGSTPDGLARLKDLGRRYIAAGGAHAALVREWLSVTDPAGGTNRPQ